MKEQIALVLEASATTDEAAAFADGRLYLIVKEHSRYHCSWGGLAGAKALSYDGPFSTVHVISKPAGGEIRGYVRVDGALYLRTPAYPPDWPELDAEVSQLQGCPVAVRKAEV